jgi:iron complex transport system permease protein
LTSETAGRVAVLATALAALAALAVASLVVGARGVAPAEVLRAFTDFAGTDDHLIVRGHRAPRTGLAICVGAALAVSGALIQAMTRNPLAEPGIIGATSGAAFAVVLGSAFGLAAAQGAEPALAVAGAAVATLVVFAVGRTSPLRLVLTGVALSTTLAGVSLGMRLMLPEVFDHFRIWSVGSLAGREQAPLAVPVTAMAVALAGALLVSRRLGAIALGENVAHALGVHVGRTRVLTLALVTVLAGAATAVAGPIAFVGLIVPHLARRLAGGSVPWLVAHAIVLGPMLVVAADTLSRVLLPTGEVPVAIVTSFLGGPALIWVVRRYGAVAL